MVLSGKQAKSSFPMLLLKILQTLVNFYSFTVFLRDRDWHAFCKPSKQTKSESGYFMISMKGPGPQNWNCIEVHFKAEAEMMMILTNSLSIVLTCHHPTDG